MEILRENYLEILTFIFLSFGIIITIVKNDENDTRFSRKTKIILVADVFISFLLIVFSFSIHLSDHAQMNRIEKFDSLNNKLSARIDSLASINDSITAQIHTIVNDSKLLSETNLSMTNKSNELIMVVNKATKKQSDENALSGQFAFDLGRPVYDTSTITVIYGTITGVNSVKPIPGKWYTGTNFIKFQDGSTPITFDVINNKLVMSLKVYDLNGDLVVSIENNNWSRYATNTGRFNYDKKGFEIFDKKGNIILNVDILANNKIKLQGYLIDRENHFILIGGQQASVPWAWGNEVKDNALLSAIHNIKITQLFKYSGENWIGARLK